MANSVERFPTNPGSTSKPKVHHYQPTPPEISSPATEELKGSSTNPKPPRPSKPSSPFFRGFFWGATFSLTAAVSATIGASITLISPLSPNIVPLIQKAIFPWENPQAVDNNWGSLFQYKISRPVNVLIMGIDRVADAPKGSPKSFDGRSDTMLLLRFDPRDHSARMLSIPRDSRVEIPGIGYSKINDANIQGGPALAARVVSKSLNDIPVDRYVRVTTDAFKELIDLVGGVEVFVPYPMQYRDMTQKLNINLDAGWQTLNGEQAEQFARFRKDQYGDIGRVQRQQVLLKALQKRIYSPAIIPRIPQAINILQQYIDTNLSLEEMLALANFGRELQRENLKMVMLPGRFSQPGEYDGRSYWIPNESGRDRVMQDYFGTDSPIPVASTLSPQRIRLAIENATDDPDLGHQMSQILAKQGFHNVYLTKDSPQLLRETEIIVQQGDLEAAKALQSTLGIGRVEVSSTGDLESDLTLRLGLDARSLLTREQGSSTVGERSRTTLTDHREQ